MTKSNLNGVSSDENLDRIAEKLSDSDLENIVDVWNRKNSLML